MQLQELPQIQASDLINFLEATVTREQTKLVLSTPAQKTQLLKDNAAARYLLKIVKHAVALKQKGSITKLIQQLPA